MDDVRLALRRLVKRPGASLASIATLACAIGAAVATWSLVSSTLLRPLPVTEPDRLVIVGTRDGAPTASPVLSNGLLYPIYPLVRDSGVFERVAAGGFVPRTVLISAGGLPQAGQVYFASDDFFDVLGVRLPIGRGFTKENDQRGAAPVAVLSDRLWRTAFGADPNVLSRQITVGSIAATIVGVTPPRFRGLDLSRAPDLYLPLQVVADVAPPFNAFAEPSTTMSPTSWITVVSKLRPESDSTDAVRRLNVLSSAGAGRGRQFGVTPVNVAAIPEAARAGMSQFTRLLGITVGLLLLIGCLTVGMLLLIRTEARRDEFAMCLALGATRSRLASSVAIEGAVLSTAGAVLALPCAWWLFAGIRAFQLPGGVEIDLLELSIDRRGIAAAAGAAIVATLLISLVAGAFGFPADIADVLRSRAGATPRLTRRRTRMVLVAAQVAVAVVLTAGAGLFARSLIAALALNPGFDTSHIVTSSISLAPYGYMPTGATTFYDDLRDGLTGNPAIRSVSMTDAQGGMGGKLIINGVPRQLPSSVAFLAVDDRYFSTMGIPIVGGRDLAASDTAQAPLVTVVSQSFGRQLSNGGSPIGQKITMPFHKVGQPAAVIDVVGVVPDVVTSVAVLQPLVMYLPLAQQAPSTSRTIVMRAAADPATAIREATSAIKHRDPAVTPSPMLTIDERIGRQMSPQRFGAVVMAALGVIAVLLTVLGTYVVAESMTMVRLREMGIRAALGATAGQLRAIVLLETIRLVGSGLVVGGLLAWSGASTIRAFLFQITPLDPATLGSVAAMILTLALAVSLRPALRATRVDLARLLREE